MYCMGTLINDRYAITTARCVQGYTYLHQLINAYTGRHVTYW